MLIDAERGFTSKVTHLGLLRETAILTSLRTAATVSNVEGGEALPGFQNPKYPATDQDIAEENPYS
jgi:hypothetical protein